MAFEDELEPDWFYELPFYLTALVVYGALFTLNPTLRWGARERAPENLVPIEFVATLPAPSPNLAPAPGGDGKIEAPPQKGPGEFQPEKVKAGAPDAPPKPLPNPKPAAVKAKIAPPKPRPKAAVKAPVRPAVDAKAVIAASIARRQKTETANAVKAAAAAESARRAAEAKAAAEARAELARERAEAARAEKARRAAQARAEADRRAEAARIERERLAAARAAKARKTAELSQTLATMNDPDEALDAAAPAAGGGAARKAGAAAALAGAAESADPGDAAGSGGADILDAKAKGGGAGPDGSGVSYSLDGPVGRRRVLRRAVPSSPDWVGSRGLDLTVTVRFQVLPDGSVKAGAVILKTSGFPEIDRRALDALRRWRFEAVPNGGSEVWGRVKFRFTS